MTTRQMPVDSRYEFMRHQIGEIRFKNITIGSASPTSAPFFRLIGYGETEEKAKKRALRNKQYQEWAKAHG